MDNFPMLENYTKILEAFAISLVIIYLLSLIYQNTKTPKNSAPEASGAWPILGHFTLFSGLPHVALSSLADRYGPIFTVRLGVVRILLVSNWEIAKEIFTTHDVNVSYRPKYLAAKILGHNYASFTFAPYGPYWRAIRKIISTDLLASSQLEKLKYIRVNELENSITNLVELWREKTDSEGKVIVEMSKWFWELNMNTMLRMVAGKRYTGGTFNGEEEEEMKIRRKVMREWFHYLGLFVVADMLPFLGWLDIGGHEKTMKRVATELDSMVGNWLDEHRQKRAFDAEIKNFLEVMIEVVENAHDLVDYDADTIIKATCTSLIVSSADTTTVMLTWALSLLLNNPKVLKKAQEEIETHVGKDRQVNESDIKYLVYLQAIVKETLRLYPAGFLGGPRVFSKDCTVGGYHVPKGTWLLINMWKLHRDPMIWSNPCEFRPERFLTDNHKNVDVIGGNFELIPFGAGRRSCPGIGLADQMLHVVLATLLQNFEMSTPNNAPVDMTASPGMTNAKAIPLEVLLTPRFHP